METMLSPGPPGNQSRRFPHRQTMGPPPLRGLCMFPISAPGSVRGGDFMTAFIPHQIIHYLKLFRVVTITAIIARI